VHINNFKTSEKIPGNKGPGPPRPPTYTRGCILSNVGPSSITLPALKPVHNTS